MIRFDADDRHLTASGDLFPLPSAGQRPVQQGLAIRAHQPAMLDLDPGRYVLKVVLHGGSGVGVLSAHTADHRVLAQRPMALLPPQPHVLRFEVPS